MKTKLSKSVLVFFLLLSLIFCYPILKSGNNLGIQDWDIFISSLEFGRKAVLQYKQLPLWDAFHCGGMPAFGNPQSEYISLTFLLVLLFGTVLGVKISIFLHYFIGLLGFYYLAKHLKFSFWAQLLSSVIFAFSGVLSSALSTGMFVFIYVLYMPWIYLFLLRAIEDRKISWLNIFLASFGLSLVYYGGAQVAILFVPALVIFVTIFSLSKRSIFPLLKTIFFIIMFLFLIFPKLYLNISLLNSFPRFAGDPPNSGYRISQVIYFLLSRNQNIEDKLALRGYSWEVDENSLYVGVLATLLFVVGFATKISKKTPYSFSLIIILLFMMGLNIKPSLYVFLKTFPFYNMIRVAQRFRFDFILFFALFAGWGLDEVRKNRFFKTSYISLTIILIVVADLTSFAWNNFFSKIFILQNPIKSAFGYGGSATAITIRVIDVNYSYSPDVNIDRNLLYTTDYLPWSSEYVAIASDKATRECIEPVPVVRYARTQDEKAYKGEVFSAFNSKFVIETWSPNVVRINLVDVKYHDYIVLNQNYMLGWHGLINKSNHVEGESFEGLISVAVNPGDREVELYYNPFIK